MASEVTVADQKLKLIIASVGTQFGGVGKTTATMLVAEYIKSTGRRISVVDADSGKWGKPSSIGYFYGGKAARLDIQNQEDLDGLLDLTVEGAADAVILDAPANSAASLNSWWSEVVTREALDDVGIRMIVLGVIAPMPGAVQSTFDSIADIGDRATYLIALNRSTLQSARGSIDHVFSEWATADKSGLDIHSFTIPHVQRFAMDKFVLAGKTPATLNGELNYWIKRRLDIWTESVNAQLSATGLF